MVWGNNFQSSNLSTTHHQRWNDSRLSAITCVVLLSRDSSFYFPSHKTVAFPSPFRSHKLASLITVLSIRILFRNTTNMSGFEIKSVRGTSDRTMIDGIRSPGTPAREASPELPGRKIATATRANFFEDLSGPEGHKSFPIPHLTAYSGLSSIYHEKAEVCYRFCPDRCHGMSISGRRLAGG